jgi:hypothetical protein
MISSALELADANFIHCHDIWLTSLLRLLIFRAPGADRISQVRAFVMYLGIIAHADEEEDENKCRMSG